MTSTWVGPRFAALLIASLAGSLTVLPAAEPLLAASAWLGILALSTALARAAAHGLTTTFLCGLAFGTAANAVALWSLLGLLMRFAHLSGALALLVAWLAWSAQGLLYGLSALGAELAVRRGLPRWLALPITTTFVLTWGPQLFPWQLGNLEAGFLPFIQLAELGGTALVSCMLVLSAAAAHTALSRASFRRHMACIAVAALALPVLYGRWRIAEVAAERAAAPVLALGVVQSNVGIEAKRDAQRSRAILTDLRALTRDVEAQGAELTLWGETAYPYPLLRSERVAPNDTRRPLGTDVRGPILSGLESYASLDEGAAKFNSAWLFRADGGLGDRVDKVRLLAFGEYVPLWDELPLLHNRFPSRGFTAGSPNVVRTAWGKIGVLICYEDLFGQLARQTVALGARVLVNLTNDAWFGPGREPLLHDMAARMRAVEQRRDLVRAVNTGVSSFTSAAGESIHRTRAFTRTSFVAQARLLDRQTPYARFGEWVSAACALAFCGAFMPRAWHRTRAQA